MRRRIIAALILATVPLAITPPVHAQFFGGVVFDPTNYGQNILTAARTLQTVNNQIRQLQNEADMLISDAKNLVRSGYNPQMEINRLLGEISNLMDRAQSITYEIVETGRIFRENYPEDYSAWSKTEMATAAEFQWVTSRNALHDALMVQSQIVQTVKADASTLDRLLTQTETAEGALAVAQTGNQIAALDTKQAMQMQELMAAQYRAESLERARRLQIERESKVKHTRFVGVDSAYTRR